MPSYPKEPLFHRGHYNILAAQFRRKIDKYNKPYSTRSGEDARAIFILKELADSVAERLKEDNENFDKVTWLRTCGALE